MTGLTFREWWSGQHHSHLKWHSNLRKVCLQSVSKSCIQHKTVFLPAKTMWKLRCTIKTDGYKKLCTGSSKNFQVKPAKLKMTSTHFWALAGSSLSAPNNLCTRGSCIISLTSGSASISCIRSSSIAVGCLGLVELCTRRSAPELGDLVWMVGRALSATGGVPSGAVCEDPSFVKWSPVKTKWVNHSQHIN